MHFRGTSTGWRRNRYGVLGVGLGIAVVGILLGNPGPQSAAAQGPRTSTRLVGLSAPSHRAAVSAEQSGTIVVMAVADGDRVKVGDELFRLSSRLQQLEVDGLQATVDSELGRERANKGLEHARLKADRMRELSEQNISAKASLQEAEFESELARLSVGKAEFERVQLRNALEKAKEQLAQRTLRSPLNGIVVRRLKQLGESAEQLEPVIEVMSLDPLWVQFECPLAREKEFPKGGRIRVWPVIGEFEPRFADIEHVSHQATVTGHTVMVRASLPNPDYLWKAGLKMGIEVAPPVEAAPAPSGK
tara:strand:- start:506 stop:1417 length:912 start_codon:yes stop_codon:yes gene_type:complete